jgi:dihydroorotate dehydrogenase electron transfer subunit
MEILKNEKIAPETFLLTIVDKKIAATSKPGQFVNIRVRDSHYPLLRRPLSVFSASGEAFDILYKVVGEGTEVLSKRSPGEELDVIGPLGNPFSFEDYGSLLLVAGGIGVAPLHFLGARAGDRKVTTLIGARTKEEVLCESRFAGFGEVAVATEDGSYGTKGLVTDLLKTIETPDIIFACGPEGMLRAIKSYSQSHSIPCQLSLEQRMACGMGVCLGCAVPAKGGYKYVCKDGPVFRAEEVDI